MAGEWSRRGATQNQERCGRGGGVTMCVQRRWQVVCIQGTRNYARQVVKEEVVVARTQEPGRVAEGELVQRTRCAERQWEPGREGVQEPCKPNQAGEVKSRRCVCNPTR